MAHVIFSRNNDNGILTTDRIRQLAPAVFSTTKRDTLSDRYAPLHTADLLPVLADYGYQPVQAAQKRSRNGNAEHAMHMLAFAKPDSLVDGLRSEIVLFNSHDGTSSVRLFAGAFRMICTNGLIAGDGYNSRTYHNRSAMSAFEEVLRNTIDNLPHMMGQIDTMRGVMLDRRQAYDLAVKAVATRWDNFDGSDKLGTFAVTKTVTDVLQAQRIDDEGSDLWTLFNRIEENITRGNAFIRSLTAQNPAGTMRKARPVQSISEHQRLKTELWDIAQDCVTA